MKSLAELEKKLYNVPSVAHQVHGIYAHYGAHNMQDIMLAFWKTKREIGE